MYPQSHLSLPHLLRIPRVLGMLAVCLGAGWLLSTSAMAWGAPDTKAAQRPIKRLFKAVKLQKDSIALKSFDGDGQGQLIFGELWTQRTAEERARFVKALHGFFTVVAFPNIRKDLEHLDTTLYGEPTEISPTSIKLRATLVVLHQFKKDEIPVDFILHKRGDAWLVRDFTINPKAEKPSFISDLRDNKLKPLLEKRGWDGLVQAMEKRVQQLQEQQKKAQEK